MMMMKSLIAAALVATTVAVPAMAETVGNPAAPASFVDSSPTLTFVLDQGFTTAGRLDSFSFFAGRGGDVTPLLFSRDDTGGTINFTITGIGTTRNVDGGAFTFDFGLTEGSNLTGATSFFGFRTASVGVVTYDYQSDTLPGAFAKVTIGDMVGTVLSFDPASRASDNGNGLNFRGYSINATAGAVPEPASWAMMIGGIGLAGSALRRRRKVSVAVRFA